MLTLSAKESDSIVQKMNFNGNSADVSIHFKDTLGKTKVSWKAKGQMGFLFKVMTAFNGGAGKILGSMFEKSLVNLDKKLDYEINTYSVKVDGLHDAELVRISRCNSLHIFTFIKVKEQSTYVIASCPRMPSMRSRKVSFARHLRRSQTRFKCLWECSAPVTSCQPFLENVVSLLVQLLISAQF